MKYKLIKSMAHNWTHSFTSEMNYVDGDFMFRDVHQLARDHRGKKIVVTWIPVPPEEPAYFTSRIRTMLEHYRKHLPAHLERHQVAPACIVEMRTEVYVENHRMYVRSYVLDDLGKEHVQFVWN